MRAFFTLLLKTRSKTSISSHYSKPWSADRLSLLYKNRCGDKLNSNWINRNRCGFYNAAGDRPLLISLSVSLSRFLWHVQSTMHQIYTIYTLCFPVWHQSRFSSLCSVFYLIAVVQNDGSVKKGTCEHINNAIYCVVLN